MDIKGWLFKKVFLNILTKNILEILDWAGEKIGPNGGKTLLGLVAVALSITKAAFPDQAAFIDPLYQALGLEDAEVVGVSAIYVMIGYAHKVVKGLRTFITAAEEALPK